MTPRHALRALAILCSVSAAGAATAATYTIDVNGQVANFQESQFTFNNNHYDEFYLPLSGYTPVTVAQGDMINSTVTLDQSYTVPASLLHTDFLQYFFGQNFPNENTGVDGTFTLYNQGAVVATYGYSSTTSSALASYAALFPPLNGAVTFDLFTNDFTINTLATPATISSSAFEYALVSPGVPEPATWGLMLIGLGLAGGGLRRRGRVTAG